MNKYNHWIAKIVLFLNRYRWTECAITIGQTSYFSCAEKDVSDSWHHHEDKHKEQWRRDGRIKFTILYFWWSLLYGYENNPYEVEAQRAEDNS